MSYGVKLRAHATATFTGEVGQSRRAPDEDEDLNHRQLGPVLFPTCVKTYHKAHHGFLSLSPSHMFHTHWKDNASRFVDNQAPDVQAKVSVRRG